MIEAGQKSIDGKDQTIFTIGTQELIVEFRQNSCPEPRTELEAYEPIESLSGDGKLPSVIPTYFLAEPFAASPIYKITGYAKFEMTLQEGNGSILQVDSGGQFSVNEHNSGENDNNRTIVFGKGTTFSIIAGENGCSTANILWWSGPLEEAQQIMDLNCPEVPIEFRQNYLSLQNRPQTRI